MCDLAASVTYSTTRLGDEREPSICIYISLVRTKTICISHSLKR